MISLAAWITVSMSALSKLRTTKRPRCAGGTGGAVEGGGGTGTGAAASGGAGGSSGLGRCRLDEQPAMTTTTIAAATRRFILLARRRHRLTGRILGNRGDAAAEARYGAPER